MKVEKNSKVRKAFESLANEIVAKYKPESIMASTKELLAQKLKQNTEKHQQAQKDNIKELKEFRRNVPIEDISRSPNQPRKVFEESQLKELADSINEIGLLQPLQCVNWII